MRVRRAIHKDTIARVPAIEDAQRIGANVVVENPRAHGVRAIDFYSIAKIAGNHIPGCGCRAPDLIIGRVRNQYPVTVVGQGRQSIYIQADKVSGDVIVLASNHDGIPAGPGQGEASDGGIIGNEGEKVCARRQADSVEPHLQNRVVPEDQGVRRRIALRVQHR